MRAVAGMETTAAEATSLGITVQVSPMARTLGAYRGDLLMDEHGKPRKWREDLVKAIVGLQQPDGSWVNERNPDFWEVAPVVATAMAINALNACLK